MDDLRDRFATLDRIAVPGVWSDVERRLDALGSTVSTRRLVASTPEWRGAATALSTGSLADLRRRRTVQLLIAAAVLVVLIGSAIAVGSGLVRLPAVVPVPTEHPSQRDVATPTATQPIPSPSLAAPLGGGLVLAEDLPRIDDFGAHDVVALDAGTGARTQLGTLPGGGYSSYVLQWNAARDRVLILTNYGLGPVASLESPTDASGPFGFIAKPAADDGTGLFLSPRGDLIAGIDSLDRPTRIVISGVDAGSRSSAVPSGIRRLLVVGWSPDQTAVLAMGCRPCNMTQTPTERQTSDHGHLYVVPVDGSPWRELLDESNGYFTASWSPDGSMLAATDFTCGGDTKGPRCAPGGRSTMSLVAVADGTARTVTSATQRTEMAAWSPDGKSIAYLGGTVGDVLGSGGVYVRNVDGTGGRRLADTTADQPPIWSPDGQWLLYRKDPGTTEWWIVPAAGGSPRLLGTFGGVAW